MTLPSALITIEARASKLISKSLLDILLTPDLKKDPIKNPKAAPGNLKKVYPSKANIHLFISKIFIQIYECPMNLIHAF